MGSLSAVKWFTCIVETRCASRHLLQLGGTNSRGPFLSSPSKSSMFRRVSDRESRPRRTSLCDLEFPRDRRGSRSVDLLYRPAGGLERTSLERRMKGRTFDLEMGFSEWHAMPSPTDSYLRQLQLHLWFVTPDTSASSPPHTPSHHVWIFKMQPPVSCLGTAVGRFSRKDDHEIPIFNLPGCSRSFCSHRGWRLAVSLTARSFTTTTEYYYSSQ